MMIRMMMTTTKQPQTPMSGTFREQQKDASWKFDMIFKNILGVTNSLMETFK